MPPEPPEPLAVEIGKFLGQTYRPYEPHVARDEDLHAAQYVIARVRHHDDTYRSPLTATISLTSEAIARAEAEMERLIEAGRRGTDQDLTAKGGLMRVLLALDMVS